MTLISGYTKIITDVWRRTVAQYLSKKRAEMAKPWLKGDVLDIGCGGEYSLTHFLDAGQHYVGVDIQEELIQRLRQTKPSYEFHCIDVDRENELVSTINSQFDTVVLLAVIEHLRHPQAVISQCRSLLKDGGTLIMTTPAVWGDKLVRFIEAALGVKHEEIEKYSPHLIIFNEQTLRNLLTSENKFSVRYYKRFELGLNQLIIASKEGE